MTGYFFLSSEYFYFRYFVFVTAGFDYIVVFNRWLFRQTPDRILCQHAPDRTVNVRPEVARTSRWKQPSLTGRERSVPVDVRPPARRRTHRRRRGGSRGGGRRWERRTWLRSIDSGGGDRASSAQHGPGSARLKSALRRETKPTLLLPPHSAKRRGDEDFRWRFQNQREVASKLKHLKT